MREEEATKAEQTLSGLNVVVSGRVEGYTRDEAKEAVMRAGGKSASSVSKNTDLLVYGEKAGSKLKKARELGVTCLPQKYFSQLLAEGIAAALANAESGDRAGNARESRSPKAPLPASSPEKTPLSEPPASASGSDSLF